MRSDGKSWSGVPGIADGGAARRRGSGTPGLAAAGSGAGCEPTDASRLRAAWRRQSLSAGWLAEDDWWTAAVDAVAAAACRDGSLRHACAMLGRARARAGVGITEALTDVAALFRVLGEGTPPLEVLAALAEGWADAGLARMSDATCEDPLTGLVSLAYLRTRLGEVYREARQRGTCPEVTHRLVVVELPRRGDPWRRIALVILVGHDLRAAFPGGDTLSLGRPGPAIALVQVTDELTLRFTRLRRAIRAALGTEVRMIRLPARQEDAEELLAGLAH
ncbi:MAG TPA: hypothetical protein VKV33_06155 [Streptosporangiaceae bacterium]|nr:hypothetical protein [Streptosporangiaceae bacterium]